MRKWTAMVTVLALAALPFAAGAQDQRQTPYWASIAAGKARMRTGPGRTYPATWLYQRADLPIKVVEVYSHWRKIEDPGGTIGWMQVNLLSDTRTAIVTGDEPRPMREAPAESAKVRFLAEPGVVGRLSDCANDWCRLDVQGREGYVRADHFWGTDPGEVLE
ncbi:SH3 domain-containing protein [Allosphingosinicella sp.]|uniref:SH3 domain-containing protein n=1 Tax=Allosphingosinicella sp. TaxID=2823234 RepID=UPI002FC18EAC